MSTPEFGPGDPVHDALMDFASNVCLTMSVKEAWHGNGFSLDVLCGAGETPIAAVIVVIGEDTQDVIDACRVICAREFSSVPLPWVRGRSAN